MQTTPIASAQPAPEVASRGLLIIGGAGYVGSIIRATVEGTWRCTHLDRRAVLDSTGRVIVGDVSDDLALAEAVRGQESLLYLAMGTLNNDPRTYDDINAAFDVNVRGFYRALWFGLDAGIRRFVYASSLSVYANLRELKWMDESMPADDWQPYGFSKRVGEFIGAAAASHCPEASVLALRLYMPKSDEKWAAMKRRPPEQQDPLSLAPNDLRRLISAALDFNRPGFHVVQATGDLAELRAPSGHADSLLGWRPRGD